MKPRNIERARRIRRVRAASGLSQWLFAARIGVKPDTYASWERRGAEPSLETVLRLERDWPDVALAIRGSTPPAIEAQGGQKL